MKKTLCILFVLIGFIGLAAEPTKELVAGKVIDASTNEPIAGAKVYIPELGKVIYTDFDGQFSVPANNQERLSFTVTYVSFKELHLRKLTTSDNLTLKLHGTN